jgi:hypothetical protein
VNHDGAVRAGPVPAPEGTPVLDLLADLAVRVLFLVLVFVVEVEDVPVVGDP